MRSWIDIPTVNNTSIVLPELGGVDIAADFGLSLLRVKPKPIPSCRKPARLHRTAEGVVVGKGDDLGFEEDAAAECFVGFLVANTGQHIAEVVGEFVLLVSELATGALGAAAGGGIGAGFVERVFAAVDPDARAAVEAVLLGNEKRFA